MKPAQTFHGYNRSRAQNARGLQQRLVANSQFFALGAPKTELRTALWTRGRLGVEPSVQRVLILLAALVLGCIDLTGANTKVPNAGESIDLPEPRLEGDVPVERALAARRSVREYSGEPLRLADLAQLVWAAQGITHPAGYRTTPSAGALYPLELYLVAGEVLGLEAGVYRYVPAGHRLVRHAGDDARGAVARAALMQVWIADAPARR